MPACSEGRMIDFLTHRFRLAYKTVIGKFVKAIQPPAPVMYLSILVLFRADVEQSRRQASISSAYETMVFQPFFGGGVMHRLGTDWLELECPSDFSGRIICDRLLAFRGA
jgi:hypothetical protein